MKRKKIMLIAALSAVVALFAFSAAACKKNKGNVAGELTFRHFEATATAELGEMFLLNSNNAVDGSGNEYTPTITVTRGGTDITDKVNDYRLKVDSLDPFSVRYRFAYKGTSVDFVTEVTVTDNSAPSIQLGETLPEELGYMETLTLPEITVTDTSGEVITPAVSVYSNYETAETLIEGNGGSYVMPDGARRAIVVITATDSSGNVGELKEEIRVKHKNEIADDAVTGILKGLDASGSNLCGAEGIRTLYYADDEGHEVLRFEVEPGAVVPAPPKVVINCDEQPTRALVKVDMYFENIHGWKSITLQKGGSSAAGEFGHNLGNYEAGEWVHIEHNFTVTAADKTHDPAGNFDSILFTYAAAGYGAEVDEAHTPYTGTVLDPNKLMAIEIKNLVIEPLPEEEELPEELGLLRNIGNIGNIDANYPFHEVRAGNIDGSPALEIVIPAGTRLADAEGKTTTTAAGAVTFDIDLKQEFPIGSVVKFAFETENMNLYAAVTGYGTIDEHTASVTSDATVTRKYAFVATKQNANSAAASVNTFSKLLFYLELNHDRLGTNLNDDITLKNDVKIRLADLEIITPDKLGDVEGLLGIEMGSDSTFITAGTKLEIVTTGDTDQKTWLQFTIPGSELGTHASSASLWFVLAGKYAAGTVIKFEWETENLPLVVAVQGFDGTTKPVTAQDTSSVWNVNSANITTTAAANPQSIEFNHLQLWFNPSRTEPAPQADLSQNIIIRIRTLTFEAAAPPEPGLTIDGIEADASSPVLLMSGATIEQGKLSDGETDCFVITVTRKVWYEATGNGNSWQGHTILAFKLGRDYAKAHAQVKIEYSGLQEWSGSALALKWDGYSNNFSTQSAGFTGYNDATVTLDKTFDDKVINGLEFEFLRADYTPDVTPDDENIVIKIAITVSEAEE